MPKLRRIFPNFVRVAKRHTQGQCLPALPCCSSKQLLENQPALLTDQNLTLSEADVVELSEGAPAFRLKRIGEFAD
jgi:hypothetical protein